MRLQGVPAAPLTIRLALRPRQQPTRLLFPSFTLCRNIALRLAHVRRLYVSASSPVPSATEWVDRVDSLLVPGPKVHPVTAANTAPSHSNTALSIGRPRSPHRTLTTLDPRRLDRECFLDISEIWCPYIYASFSEQGPPERFTMRYTKTMPFPAETKGFLYYFANTRSPLESQVRFRVTGDNDPASFSRGHDLVYDKGYVWHIRLLHIVSHRQQRPVLRSLIHDGLVDKQVINIDAARNPGGRHQRIKRSVSSLREPFVLGLSLLQPSVVAFVAGQKHRFTLIPPQIVHRKRLYDEGTILVRMERSTLPQHAGQRVVVLRLLKILETPKQVSDPDPDADTTFPAEGELFTKYGRVWYRTLNKSKWLRALYDADDGQES